MNTIFIYGDNDKVFDQTNKNNTCHLVIEHKCILVHSCFHYSRHIHLFGMRFEHTKIRRKLQDSQCDKEEEQTQTSKQGFPKTFL